MGNMMARVWDQGLQAGTGASRDERAVPWLRTALVVAVLALAACAPAPRAQLTYRAPAMMDLAATGPATSQPAQPSRANTPGELVGLSGVQVAGLLGTPSLTRHDDPAEVWQYADGGCVLLVFLYGPTGSAGRVSHAETRGAGASAQCFNRLRGRAPQAVPSPG